LLVLDNLDRHDTYSFGEKGAEFRFGCLGRGLDISVAEALNTQQFFVIGWRNLNESFLPATRTYDFV
jgi:hypothetical protein